MGLWEYGVYMTTWELKIKSSTGETLTNNCNAESLQSAIVQFCAIDVENIRLQNDTPIKSLSVANLEKDETYGDRIGMGEDSVTVSCNDMPLDSAFSVLAEEAA